MSLEIERKYLIAPEAIDYMEYTSKHYEIIQAYLVRESELEIRVRKKGWSYYFTVKRGSGLIREEYEVPIDVLEFKRLATGCPFVKKYRYEFHDGSHIWEIDTYGHEYDHLTIAAIELTSEDAVPTFPEWLESYVLKEVTGMPEYKNQSLCRLDYQPKEW